MHTLRQHWFSISIGAVFILYILFGIFYLRASPMYTAPDERMHVAYIQSVAGGHLPRLTAEKVTQEAYHQPLYYILMQPIVSLAASWSERMQVDALRFAGLCIGAGTVLFSVLLALRMFPNQRLVALSTAVIVALNPQFIYISASVNNDTLATMLATLGLVLLVATLQTPRCDHRSVARNALVAAALALTKTTVWPIAIALVCVTALPLLRTRQWRLLMWFLLPLAAALWWMGRNWVLYGDPTSFEYQKTLWYATFHRDFLSLSGIWTWVKTVFESFWMRFGYFNIALPTGWYRCVEAAVALSFLGLLFNRKKISRWGNQRFWHHVLWLVGLGGVAVLGLFLYALTFYQAQGRLLFPVASIFALAIAAGFAAPVPKQLRALVPVLCGGGLILLNIAALHVLSRAFV